jgi:uncharacterized membrane protein
MVYLAHFFVAAAVFVLIDAIWIGGIANNFYKDQLGRMLADKPNFGPAILFYFIYLFALLYFVIEPAYLRYSWSWLLKHAAFFGLAMYATYDLTNAATLRRWPAKLTIIDILWGTALTTMVSAATYAIFR